MMDKLIAVLFAVYVIGKCCGCAYKGDVNLYSPGGSENVIEKAVSTDAEVSLIP